MKGRTLVILLFCTIIAFTSCSRINTDTRYPTDDAYVRGGSSSGENYGSEPFLFIKNDIPAYARQSYLKFDLTGVNMDNIESAVLQVYASSMNTDPERVINLYATDTDWSESTITWSNAAEGITFLSQVVIDAAETWYEFDITEYLKSDTQGPIISFLLINEGQVTQKNDVRFVSKEGDPDFRPQLALKTTGTPK